MAQEGTGLVLLLGVLALIIVAVLNGYWDDSLPTVGSLADLSDSPHAWRDHHNGSEIMGSLNMRKMEELRLRKFLENLFREHGFAIPPQKIGGYLRKNFGAEVPIWVIGIIEEYLGVRR